MTSPPDPSPAANTAEVAAQVAALRGQVAALKTRLDNDVIGKHLVALAEIKRLRSQMNELAQTMIQPQTETRDGRRPHGPAAPYWIDLSPQDHASQLAELRQWADTVLSREYGGYQLPDCWPNHPHAIWELSTLAAEWHRTYSDSRPSLDRALEFHDRWLPGTMRRIADITRRCNPECAARPRALNTAHRFTPPDWQPSAPWGRDPRP
jgi:hypothetical protein